MYPRIAPAKTMKELFVFFKTKTTTKLKVPIKTILQSDNVSSPISIQTAAITETAAIFKASKKLPISLDFLTFGIKGLKIATNINEGIKIPIVAAIAP